ncbi:hypothetical protein HWB52_gp83 [Pseudomonas phage Littlefix]|uniref:Uncharacterized protein n=1 Tax=Pseudomonas phage Littlefix TaxID=2079289 RepID=A0A2K9VHY8_9CAUD|nr:hypothetical protein HWB52_gp83 [Pseudomonas phage Littlefix]AUV61898.1 hypothetical protein PsPhLittlefix_gp83 [Pseudomonas phage Littlefix]
MARTKGFRQIKFTDEQLAELKKRYEAGESTTKLSRIYGMHPTTTVTYLRQLGAVIKPAHAPSAVTEAQLGQVADLKSKGYTWAQMGELFKVNDKTLRHAYYRYLKRDEQ